MQLDRDFNASTFTARIVTSTLAPPTSAIAAAMGTLYGQLHGAADQQALEMAKSASLNRVVDPRSRISAPEHMKGWL